MNVVTTDIPGVLILEPQVFKDTRGSFLETFHQQRYWEAGIPYGFVQDNVSQSGYGTLRGLHYQIQHPQGKLCWVLRGEVSMWPSICDNGRQLSGAGPLSG